MPNRILREGILTSPRMAKLGWAEEVFYRRLHSVVDDFGRYYADAGLLRAACYPRQLNKVSDSDIGKWLSACSDAALVRVYPAQDGERYLEVLDFAQQVRAKKSKFPGPIAICTADAAQTICASDALADPLDSEVQADAPVFVFGGEDVGEVVVGPTKTEEAPPLASPASPKTDDDKPLSQVTTRPSKRCPENFVVTSELRQWAADATPLVDVVAETAAMKDHTYSKAITAWEGAWRNWMRRAQGYALERQIKARHKGPANPEDRVAQHAEAAAGAKALLFGPQATGALPGKPMEMVERIG